MIENSSDNNKFINLAKKIIITKSFYYFHNLAYKKKKKGGAPIFIDWSSRLSDLSLILHQQRIIHWVTADLLKPDALPATWTQLLRPRCGQVEWKDRALMAVT
jgi:hypothetical protein